MTSPLQSLLSEIKVRLEAATPGNGFAMPRTAQYYSQLAIYTGAVALHSKAEADLDKLIQIVEVLSEALKRFDLEDIYSGEPCNGIAREALTKADEIAGGK